MINQIRLNSHTPLNTDPTQCSVQELIALNRYAAHFQLPNSAIKSHYNGATLSPFKGRGMELTDLRRYEENDDVRDINWMALAKTGQIYTNLYQEERERPLYLWVDQSESMQFATRGRFKSVVAANLAALAGWREIKNHNRIGGFMVSDYKIAHFKAARSRNSFVRLLGQLGGSNKTHESKKHKNETSNNGAKAPLSFYQKLKTISRVENPGTALYIFSDFRGWDDLCRDYLLRLSKHQDILLTMILDPIELNLPKNGSYRFANLANRNKQVKVNTADKKLLKNYYSSIQKRIDAIMGMAKFPGINCTQVLTTDEPIVTTFQQLNEHRAEFRAGVL